MGNRAIIQTKQSYENERLGAFHMWRCMETKKEGTIGIVITISEQKL